jgi:serine/threonine protein kinase
MAPELFENNDQISTNKLFSCDIFSLGILIFKLFFGHLPFNYPDVSNGKFDY